MSAKIYDHKSRWRNKTVAFRMSPEEAEMLDNYAKLSGLTKQDYLIHRVLAKEIIVNGNPRVFKALRNRLDDVFVELKRLESICADNGELLELIGYIATILNGLKEGENV